MSSEKTKPSKALLKDLKRLFEKHNWPGAAIGISQPSSTAIELNCQPPAKPTLVTIALEDGTKVTKTVCL